MEVKEINGTLHKKVRIPCPDGREGCLVAHYRWIPVTNKYRIIDNSKEVYEIEAENALSAVVKWIETYNNLEVLEWIAENKQEYLARLQIVKI